MNRAVNENSYPGSFRSGASQSSAQFGYSSTIVTPEEYRLLYAVPRSAGVRKTKRRWRFKPRSIWALVIWGIIVFAGFRILAMPLAEGLYNYVTRNHEISQLRTEYSSIRHELAKMKKSRDFMKTTAYVEQRGHQIGLIKANEAKMVVVQSSDDGRTFRSVPRSNQIYGD